MDCESCQELESQESWGCDGKPTSDIQYGYSGAIEPYNRICPKWYAQTVFVNDVMENLVDYKRGALGNVRQEISDAELVYLRAAECETLKWENAQNESKK